MNLRAKQLHDVCYLEITHRDGQLKEISGNAARPVLYEHGVSSGALYTKEILVGESNSRTEWTKTWRDPIGRTVTIEYPDTAESSFHYNLLGQLTKQIDPDGVTRLYTYNSLGEQTEQAIDLNADQSIGEAGRFPCIKPKDGQIWTKSTEDVNAVCNGIKKIKEVSSAPTAVLLISVRIEGSTGFALGRSTVGTNDYFIIDVIKANNMTFPHEFGHRMGWRDTGSPKHGPFHSDDDHNLMNIDGGANPDCQYCRLLLKFSK